MRVIWVRVAEPGRVWDACFAVLAEGERARALRMRAGVARNEFVTGRATLRAVLGEMLAIKAREVEIRTGLRGKPLVNGVQFSVTHARGLVGLAVCAEGQVGLDVEWVDRTCEAEEIAEMHFAAGERKVMAAAEDRVGEFFRIWTRKEAVVKALGEGLGLSLDGFDVAGSDAVEVGGRRVSLEAVEMEKVAPGWVGHVGLVKARPLIRMEVWDEARLADMLLPG